MTQEVEIPFLEVTFPENGPRMKVSVYLTDCLGVKGGNTRANPSKRSLKDHSIGSDSLETLEA